MGAQERQGWLTATAVIGTAVSVAGLASLVLRGRPPDVLWARWVIHNAPVAVASLWAARLILRRHPGHVTGRLLLMAAAAISLHVATAAVADLRLASLGHVDPHPLLVPAELPLSASVPLFLGAWLWIPPLLAAFQLLPILVEGGLPSGRWRWVPVTGFGGAVVFSFANGVEAWPTSTLEVVAYGNAAPQSLTTWVLATAGGGLIAASAIGGVTLVGVRWRTAEPVQRRQIRAVSVAGTLMLVMLVALWPWQWLWVPASLVGIWSFVATYLVAIVRYRLHDLDVVLRRAVVGAVLAAMVTGLYLAIVVGIGAFVGRGGQGTWLPLVAVGVVAVVFQPAHRRVQLVIERVLYGRDGDPSQVLSRLAARLRDAESPQEVLDRAVALLARSTGARGAQVVTHVDGREHVAAATSTTLDAVQVVAAPVLHHGKHLGEVRLLARASADLAPDAVRILADVAGTIGVVLANVRLTARLERQVVELQRSRSRLVGAHDEARRALERDLHDGAQSRLVALRLRLGLVESIGDRDGWTGASGAVRGLAVEVEDIMRSLRDLSRGLHPPVLEAAGVAAALRAEVRQLPIEVAIEESPIGLRFEPVIEAAAFFSCLEAIQNAAKHGSPTRMSITLSRTGDRVRFTVVDDGCGFDPSAVRRGAGLRNLTDRITALGGVVGIDAAVGRGCSITGELPCAGGPTQAGNTIEAASGSGEVGGLSDQSAVADR